MVKLVLVYRLGLKSGVYLRTERSNVTYFNKYFSNFSVLFFLFMYINSFVLLQKTRKVSKRLEKRITK